MMTFLLSPPSSSYLDLHFSNDKVCLPRLLSKRYVLQKNCCRSLNLYKIECKLSTVKRSSSEDNLSIVKEPHKYFDQVIITVRAGDGGHGAILTMPNQRVSKPQGRHEKEKNKKRSPSLKRDFDGSLVLPVGGIGGDIVIYADERKDTLLEFHTKKRYSAKRGGNVDSMGDLASQFRNGLAGPTLRIPVPVGTVVKLKRGKLLADLSLPGDEVLVARGGQGGISLVEVPENRRKKMMALTTNVMRDDSDKVLAHGQPGEEVSLELILRVVADVGLVGLPNAGKSTLLAAITRAKPDIADYPFTTLMPNLGRLDGDPLLGPGAFSSEATLADLPGLIEGAHLGKGLGRNFLRHLRRTRLLVHVVDAAAENPVKDYRTVREELRMYNPEYTRRPYIVVLNKMDLPQARDRLPSLSEEIVKFVFDKSPSGPEKSSEDGGIESPKSEYRGEDEDEDEDESSLGASKEDEDDQEMEDSLGPVAVVGVSVLKGINIDQMLKQIRAALRELRDPMLTQ